jgi:Fe-Mn family superoxide dismutase
MSLDKDIKQEIRRTLGLPEKKGKSLQEAYVVEPKAYDLKTDFLSDKVKRARLEVFDAQTQALNRVSAELDTASREGANPISSEFRSLKVDESRCLNESFLKARFFDNIDAPSTQLAMDSLTFMRLERDFGTFDDWQRDFIACALSARGGYVVTAYNLLLKRYMNHVVDAGGENLTVGSYPVIVLDVSEGAYYRDYVSDRRTYVVAMMKELDWDVIEERFKLADRIAKVLS